MLPLSQQITHWQNIQLSLKHVQILSESVTALFSQSTHPTILFKTAPSELEQVLQSTIEACTPHKIAALTWLSDGNIQNLKMTLQEEEQAERFEAQAKKLLEMATAVRRGAKRKFDEYIGGETVPSADEVNEQLQVVMASGQKLGLACARQRLLLKKRVETVGKEQHMVQDSEAKKQRPGCQISTGAAVFVSFKYGRTVEERRNVGSWEACQPTTKQQRPEKGGTGLKLRLDFNYR